MDPTGMSEQQTDLQAPAAGANDKRPLPPLLAPITPAQLTQTLQALSRKGKLPGYEQPSPHAFRLKAFGNPFDHWLYVAATEQGAYTRLDFHLRLARKTPGIFLIVSILTVQPGMWLTDSMLTTYFPAYGNHVNTWWWYIPLVVLPMPWILWRMWRKSTRAAHEHAHELRERLAATLKPAPNGVSNSVPDTVVP